jgi:Flp pilus assembly protein TadD
MKRIRCPAWGVLSATAVLQFASPGLSQKPLSIERLPNDDAMVLARRATEAHDPSEALARYLRVLAREPRDLEALTGAGRASLEIGDANAAISFYARAEEIAPRNGQIKAGLGSAMVQLIQPKAALKFFGDAIENGVPVSEIASDRGLAYALRGDSKRAQADYELAIAARPDPETTRRLALTEAINGDVPGAMTTLGPLLYKQDKAAWRMRVFIQAIAGDVNGAQSTANAVLSSAQATAISPFLDRFPKLRASQQAAAAQFGQFPSDGKQYSEAELFAAAGQTPPPIIQRTISRTNQFDDQQGDGITEKPEGRKSGRENRDEAKPSFIAMKDSDVLKAKKPDLTAQLDKNVARPPSESKKELKRSTEQAAKPKLPTVLSKEDSTETTRKKEADKKKPAGKDKDFTVDSKKSANKKSDSSKSTTKNSRKEPERYWVQVATGPYKPDLGKAWGKLKEKYPALLGRRTASTTPLNRTNRILIGPFKSDDETQAFVNKAAGSGFMTSRFTSPAGQAVEIIAQ